MPKYTVQCGFADYMRNYATVEAATVDEACEKAIAAAGDDDGWKSLCHAGDTFVDAICIGENENDVWSDDPDVRCEVPHEYTEAGMWGGTLPLVDMAAHDKVTGRLLHIVKATTDPGNVAQLLALLHPGQPITTRTHDPEDDPATADEPAGEAEKAADHGPGA